MNDLLTALIIGVVAGLLDALPMVFQKMDRMAVLSAFFHWVVLGVVIPFVDWAMAPWLKGLVLAELFAVPVVLMVVRDEPKAVLPITVMSALLGAAVGWAGAFFIG